MQIRKQCLDLNAIVSHSGTSDAISVLSPVADWKADCLKGNTEVRVRTLLFTLSLKTCWIRHSCFLYGSRQVSLTAHIGVILGLAQSVSGRKTVHLYRFFFFCICEEIFIDSLVLINYLIESLYINYVVLWESKNLQVHLSLGCCSQVLSVKAGSRVVKYTNLHHASFC